LRGCVHLYIVATMKSADGFISICMCRAQYWKISEVEKSKELDHFVLDSRVRKT